MTAITITDLSNAKLDVDHIAEIATSVELTATDRLGHVKSTVAAAIDSIKAFNNRGAWAAATMYAGKDLVSVSGTWYVCVVAHTSSAAFATDAASKWRVYQGVTAVDLAAPSGASLVGYMPSGAGAFNTTIENKHNERLSVFNFMTVNQIADVKARTALIDVSDALNNALLYAQSVNKEIFAPAGVYRISKTINIGAGTLRGEGGWMEGPQAGSTQFRCGAANITMISASGLGRFYDCAVHGYGLAKIGFTCTGARIHCENIEIYRCRKANFLLAKTQNSCFVNCFSQYGANGWVLANGARNNNFFSCTSANFPAYYNAAEIGVAWLDTAAITFVIDENDADYGGAGITALGQDRNNWFGGIFEQYGSGIVGKNLSGFAGAQATNNQFYGVEITCHKIVNAVSGSVGTLLLDSGSYTWDSQDDPFSAGTLGQITFKGEPFFSGGNNVDNRGITLSSNYANLFVIDTDNYYGSHYTNGSSVVSYDSAAHEFTIVGGGGTDGVSPNANIRNGVATPLAAARVGKPVGFSAVLSFTIKNITGANPVLVYITMGGSPWRRQVFSAATAGTYSVPIHIGDHANDAFGVLFANNGNTSFVVKSIVMRSASHV